MTRTAFSTSASKLAPADLRTLVEEETQRKRILDQYLHDNLMDKVDYDFSYPGAKKRTLLKPGSEKTCSLLNLVPTFSVDNETQTIFEKNDKLKGMHRGSSLPFTSSSF